MSNLHVVVGLGATGLSCIRYLKATGVEVAVTDTREAPPQLAEIQKMYPDMPILLGKLDKHLLEKAAVIVVSPGISIKEPAIMAQIKRGVPVIGDIELFAKAVKVPVIAITGTNAKSTVTTLVGEMAKAAGYCVQTGGNLGTPALDLIRPDASLYVLELSSFQLETTYTLKPAAATILNITPDHMDRYDTLRDYQQAKQRIYHHCQTAACNRDDALTDWNKAPKKIQFTMHEPHRDEFGLVKNQGVTYLAFEDQLLLPVSELPVMGKHYQANALASLAIGHAFGLPFDAMLKVLREFKGLPHRCQLVREYDGVTWYNDSKGTNVGATQAAIEGLGDIIAGKLVLIAGGVGKNADFTPLLPAVEKYARHVVLIGEAADELARVFGSHVSISRAASMNEAVLQAASAAKASDSVLLSPACASFDMFKNYVHRGEVFTEIVTKL
jgi:UDP-N-acetylmuramoylalanine--D-glutamate ligase